MDKLTGKTYAMFMVLIAVVVTCLMPTIGIANQNTTTISGSVHIDHVIATVSQKYGVNHLLIHAIISQESAYEIFAVSDKGAQGLMQLMPITQRDLGINYPFDPWQNVDGGVRYFLQQLLVFRSLEGALSAYNAGPQNETIKFRPKATIKYIEDVKNEFVKLKKLSS